MPGRGSTGMWTRAPLKMSAMLNGFGFGDVIDGRGGRVVVVSVVGAG